MSIDFETVRNIHRLLKQQSDLRDSIDRGPMKLKLIKANEQRFLSEWDSARENQKNTRMAADGKQLQLGEREAKIDQMKIRMNTCETNKEFQLIKERIAADLQANSVLQDEILEMLERLDVLKVDVENAKLNFEKSQADTQRVGREVEAESQKLRSELDRVVEELTATEKRLPGDVLKEYVHNKKGMGENVFAETDGKTCGNCNQTLTIQMHADLTMKRAVYCKGCGSLLYPV